MAGSVKSQPAPITLIHSPGVQVWQRFLNPLHPTRLCSTSMMLLNQHNYNGKVIVEPQVTSVYDISDVGLDPRHPASAVCVVSVPVLAVVCAYTCLSVLASQGRRQRPQVPRACQHSTNTIATPGHCTVPHQEARVKTLIISLWRLSLRPSFLYNHNPHIDMKWLGPGIKSQGCHTIIRS